VGEHQRCGSGTTGEGHLAIKVIVELLAVPFRITVISQLP
jgi:hypothetical protein